MAPSFRLQTLIHLLIKYSPHTFAMKNFSRSLDKFYLFLFSSTCMGFIKWIGVRILIFSNTKILSKIENRIIDWLKELRKWKQTIGTKTIKRLKSILILKCWAKKLQKWQNYLINLFNSIQKTNLITRS